MNSGLQRILLVDDEIDILVPLKKTLEMAGYNVLAATGGDEAFELFNHKDFNMLITDINMPEGDGLSLISRVKNTDLNFPVLCFLTGAANFSPEQAYRKGIEATLSKPFEFKDLSERIVWLSKSSARKMETYFPHTEGLIQLLGGGDVKLGRGGLSFEHVERQVLPSIGSLCRFHVDASEGVDLSGLGWLRWSDVKRSRIGIEIANLKNGHRVWRDTLSQPGLESYIP